MSESHAKAYDSKRTMQWFIFLDGSVRIFIWHSSIAFTVALFTYLDAWPRQGLARADLVAARASPSGVNWFIPPSSPR